MDTINPFFAFIALSIAVLTGWLINCKYQLKINSTRNLSIDGLRGFLAIGYLLITPRFGIGIYIRENGFTRLQIFTIN